MQQRHWQMRRQQQQQDCLQMVLETPTLLLLVLPEQI
jgi:hypothetical protein